MTEHDQTIILAALLYDIGSFRERTRRPLPARAERQRSEGQYGFEAFSAMLIDGLPGHWAAIKSDLRALVFNSNRPTSEDERLMALAFKISTNRWADAETSPTRRQPGGEPERDGEPALPRVLSRVVMKEQKANNRRYEPLVPFPLRDGLTDPKLLLENSVDSVPVKAYQKLWDSFEEELKRAPADISTVLALLKKYTWAIPWESRSTGDPDVSLYAQAKAMAAVTACLVKDERDDAKIQHLSDAFANRHARVITPPSILDEPLFALVKGDISGTQDFLYLLTSSGAARGLRGRSFYLQLLTETIAAWLLRQLDMPSTNLLFVGGGHFYLLLPYQKTNAELPKLRKEITRKLWEAYIGDLSLVLDFVPVTVREFTESFATKWGEVSQQVNDRKRQRLSDFDDDILKKFLQPRQLGTTAESTCAICHGEWNKDRDREEDGVRKCNRCEGFEDLGRKLRKPAYLISFTVPDVGQVDGSGDWNQVLRSFGTEVRLLEGIPNVPGNPAGATAALVSTLDSADFLTDGVLKGFRWDELPTSYDFRILASATPDGEDKQSAQFEDLAQASTGVKWLGVLRMDVDGLGEVIRDGLGGDSTIARISTLSDSLRLFFEGWVSNLCRKFYASKEGGQVYLIYAGGDDLFAVGSWSALPDLATKIRDDFRSYVGGDHISLSGGIAIEHQKYPVYQLANDAKHALDDRAKEFKRDGGRSKDALNFLQTTAGWEQFGPIIEWKDNLVAMLKPANGGKALARGFLTRLGEIHYLYEENVRCQGRRKRKNEISVDEMKEEIRYAKWVWRLVYHLERSREAYKDFAEEIARFKEQIIQQNMVERLNVIARWTELLTREEKE